MQELQTDIPESQLLDLFREFKESAKADDSVRSRAMVIEEMADNRPVTVKSRLNYESDLIDAKVTVQLLSNLILTWSSLLTKNRPSVYATPNTTDLKNVAAANIATKLIEHIEQEESVAEKWHRSAMWAAQHGTSIMKVVYDPSSERVVWEPLNIFDVYIQNVPDPSKAKWCLIRSYIDQYDAQELTGSNLPPETSTYKDGAGIDRQGVEKWELWHLPCFRFKEGIYACAIGDQIVEAMSYPYTFDEPDGDGSKSLLPIVWWSCRQTRGATLGSSWTSDCAPIQATINNLYSKIVNDALSARQMLILPSSLKDTDLLEEENAKIFLDSQNASQANIIRWLSPAPVDPNVQNTLQSCVESMYVTAGISQSTSGDAAASQSGRALAFQAELDSNKHSNAFKDFERAQKLAWELTLKLIQKYYTEVRQFSITGEDPISFRGADIQGVSIKLEPRQEKESSLAYKKQTAREDVANGFQDPASLATQYPSPQTASLTLLAEQLLDRLLAGEDVQLTPETVSPETFVQVIDKRIQSSLLRRDIESVRVLESFKKEYLMMLSSTQEPDPNQPQAQPQTSAVVGDETVQEGAQK